MSNSDCITPKIYARRRGKPNVFHRAMMLLGTCLAILLAAGICDANSVSTPYGANSALAERNWWTANFYLDNDLFANDDEGYTNGIRLSLVSPDLENFDSDTTIGPWLRSINSKLRLLRRKNENAERNMVVTFGQQIYTPDIKYRDIETLVKQDRPYAGWLFLGLGYQVRNQNVLEAAVLNLGLIGPAARAKQAQDLVHDLMSIDKFKGWDNQLKNEFGLQFLYDYKRRLLKHKLPLSLSHDVIGQWGLSLGNISSHLELGAEYRLGWFLPDDFGTSSASPGGENSSPGAGPLIGAKSRWVDSIHSFFAVTGRWVGHDITLDGNTFVDSHSVEKRAFVGRASVGVAMTMGKLKLGFSRFIISQQFKNQEQGQEFGSVFLSFTHSYQ